ncbi:hypothetical protein ACFPRL_23810 [Pseudoclavibacter helvolus]
MRPSYSPARAVPTAEIPFSGHARFRAFSSFPGRYGKHSLHAVKLTTG